MENDVDFDFVDFDFDCVRFCSTGFESDSCRKKKKKLWS